MKNIKLKLVTWLIGLLFVSSLATAQGSFTLDIPNYRDSINLDVNVDVVSDPIKVEVEAIAKTDTILLQSLLQSENRQTNALNNNLINLINAIKHLPEARAEAEQKLLKEDKDSLKVNTTIKNGGLILMLVTLLLELTFRKKIYVNTAKRNILVCTFLAGMGSWWLLLETIKILSV